MMNPDNVAVILHLGRRQRAGQLVSCDVHSL